MTQLFRLSDAVRDNPSVDAWFSQGDGQMRPLARPWFECIRQCGADVADLLHDGHPTACVGDAAFAYVDAFSAHVNIGFFHGATLADPAGLLQGAGKRMRHVKIRWGEAIDEDAVKALIMTAYRDIQNRLAQASAPNSQ
jgi:hypothetical protein